jgi:general L-amino acid transport system permease protein
VIVRIFRRDDVVSAGVCPRPLLSWSDRRTRAIVWQVVAVAAVCGILSLIAIETATTLRLRGIASGFDYLGRAAGFEIARGPLSYSSQDTYLRALEVGLVNTLRITVLGSVIATSLGLLVGIARLSTIWVVSGLSTAYVEVLRNTPLLLQLLFWYSLSQTLPAPRNAMNPLPGVFISFRGLFLPAPVWNGSDLWLPAGLFALPFVGLLVFAWSRRQRSRTGRGLPTGRLIACGAAMLMSAAMVIDRPIVGLERPALIGFDFRGGVSITPEFSALLIGLSMYTSAFIGEIVRGGILAVEKGQAEAAAALGFSRGRILRLIVLPQALPVIVPPTTSQLLNLAKNSSLAVAIGYPDLISITNTTLNQTGQAIEAIALAMTFYLGISLTMSAVMNFYNRAVARGGRSARNL